MNMTATLCNDTLRYMLALVPRHPRFKCALACWRWYRLIMTSKYKHWYKQTGWDRRIGAWLRFQSKAQRRHEELKPPYTKPELKWKEARMHHRLPSAIRGYLKYVSREFAIGEKWFTVHLKQLTSREPHQWRVLGEKRGQRIEFQMATGMVRSWQVLRASPSPFEQFVMPPANARLPFQRNYPVSYMDGTYWGYKCVSFHEFQDQILIGKSHDNDKCLGFR